MGKEKETALPKNIRQIGEIRGAEKICIEDYVMTCIHKKEPQEKDGYLGIFYGEQRKEEDGIYLFLRGILEIPDGEKFPIPSAWDLAFWFSFITLQRSRAARIRHRWRWRCVPTRMMWIRP